MGVTATFGAPIGGVLFSIELSTHIYNINNLWKALYATFIATILFRLIQMTNKIKLFDADAGYFFKDHQYIGLNHEMAFFFVLSVLLGLIGCLFVWLMKIYMHMKRRNAKLFIFNPWFYSLTMALILLNIQFFTRLL